MMLPLPVNRQTTADNKQNLFSFDFVSVRIMINKIFFLIFPILLFSPVLFSQDNEVLISIDGHNITLNEFEHSFHKNNNTSIAEKQSIDEYLNLYINFKLKVIEAENLGMDTVTSFIQELNGYMNQLAKPYLSDSASFETLLLEEYNRMNKEINASHIMIMVEEKASPEDTLIAYNKLLELRKRILSGEDFSAIAKAYSQDPSVVNNGGNLGWFGAFRMVYPFESAAYSTPPGHISMPVRSNYGFHIIKVNEIRTAKPKLHVAHIFIRAPETMTDEEAANARKKIYSIYDQLQQGAAFDKLAMTDSDDKSTGVNGGELPWFSSGEMIPVFENTAYEIKEIGLYSEPVRSFYGWHIIKLLGRKELKSFEDERQDLVKLMNSGDRTKLKQLVYMNKLKTEYHFKLFPENYARIYDFVDTIIFAGKWKNSITAVNNYPVFSIGDKTIGLLEFGEYLYLKQGKVQAYNLKIYLDDQFKAFMESKILDYEIEMLPKKYPDFSNIIQEYHDGILLFELTDKMVWSKSVEDSSGLEKYYQDNKQKYKWEERVEAFIITADNKDILNQARVLTAKQGAKKKFNSDYIKKQICPEDTIGGCLTVTYGKYEKKDNEFVDQTNWIKGISNDFQQGDKIGFVYIKKKLPAKIKKLDEAKGLISSDYQVFLEDQWLKYLKKKYTVNVNQDLLKKIN